MLVKDNKYIPVEDCDFFILLRIGLWQKVEEDLSSCPDWSYIYTLACEQTVQGLIADGIGIYRREKGVLNITQAENDRFLSASAQIVRRNFTINQKQAEINALFDSSSEDLTPDSCHLTPINYFVVKGQEAAKNYPKPMLRCSGDIDYLIQPEQMDSAREVLAPLATSIEPYEPYLQHQGFMIGDVEVELHGALHPRLGQQIDKVLDHNQELLFQTISNYSERDTVTIDTFNTEYLLLHCLQHFHWSGLGLRQIIDWVMLIATSNAIDWIKVKSDIKEMGIQHEWNLFLQFSIDWLGLVNPSLPFFARPLDALTKFTTQRTTPNHSLLSLLWQHAKESGNMGHNREQKARISNPILRITSAWIDIVRTYFRHRTLSPTVSRRLLKVQFNEYLKQLHNR